MSRPTVFLHAVTADYPAALAVYQFLTGREIPCFFADEALLKTGDPSYFRQASTALKGASWLMVVATRAAYCQSPTILDFWQAFDARPNRRAMLLPAELCPEDLPEPFQQSRVLPLTGRSGELVQLLSAWPMEAEEPWPLATPKTAKRRARLVPWVLTAANVALLLTTAWLTQTAWRKGRAPEVGDKAPLAPQLPDPNSGSRERGASPHASAVAEGQKQGSKAGSPFLADVGPPPLSPGMPEEEFVRLWKPDPASGLYQIKLGSVVQTFSYIPPGTFQMGSPATEVSRRSDEAQRTVTLTRGFWLARTECTQALWQEVTGGQPSQFPHPGHPVESVAWDDIAAGNASFLTRINAWRLLPDGLHFALPDEAQWEYACRAGTASPFAFGEVLDGSLANFDGRLPYGTPDPSPFANRPVSVARYAANDWGLYDMHGNVQEWCAPSPLATLDLALAEMKIIRGGSWRYTASLCRSASRAVYRSDVGDDTTGFRLAVVAN